MAVTLLDGAYGTALMAKINARGIEDHDPVWAFNLRYPDVVSELAAEYAAAGSEIVQANTFTANRHSVGHFSDYQVADVVREGVLLAKEGVKGTGAKVSVDVGALSMLLKPYGTLTAEECEAIYREQIEPGVKAGADLIFLETFIDLSMMEIAAKAALSYGVPVFCSMTFEKRRRTIMGNSVRQIVKTLEPLGIAAVGMNCSMGPAESLEVIREYHEMTSLPLIFKPNSGKPIVAADGSMTQPYTAEQFVEEVRPALDFVSYVGGCCGSDVSYIRALRREIDSRR